MVHLDSWPSMVYVKFSFKGKLKLKQSGKVIRLNDYIGGFCGGTLISRSVKYFLSLI